ncbi:Isochorismatase family protein 1B [Nymphon striatum]|nr:Isochorismatase family protein 1B [Nymphon striatum]
MWESTEDSANTEQAEEFFAGMEEREADEMLAFCREFFAPNLDHPVGHGLTSIPIGFSMPHQQLTDREDSVLIVIDAQRHFIDKLTGDDTNQLLNRIRWIIQMATKMDIPVVVTAEDHETVGPTDPFIAAAFPPQTLEHNKMTFGLCGDPDILGAVESTGRRTAVLVGFETDVCVMQSALGLLSEGFRVVALADATGSPGEAHEAGIERMRDAGVVISTVKSTFYEWVRSLHFADEQLDPSIWTDERPDGISL